MKISQDALDSFFSRNNVDHNLKVKNQNACFIRKSYLKIYSYYEKLNCVLIHVCQWIMCFFRKMKFFKYKKKNL